ALGPPSGSLDDVQKAAAPATHTVHSFRGFRTKAEGLSSKMLGALCLGLIVLVWFIVTLGEAEQRIVSPTILSSPLEVLQSFPALVTERGLIPSILATLRRVLLGFGLSVLVGVPVGILAASWRR